ncbi:MAG: glycerophosphodiester phosphodiesterase [Ilumatobacteraceae bacterium]
MVRRSPPRHPYLDWPGPIAFAHRGGASEAPENTLPAFERAIGLGYHYLETDVHATADGVVVAFHDDDLMRTCGRPGHISELPWKDVATARVDGREPIPLLSDLLEAFPAARFNIDCKTDRVVGPLGDELDRNGALSRVCVGSFSDRRLARIRRRFGPELCTSYGSVELGVLRVFGLSRPSVPAVQAPVTWHGRTLIDEPFVRRAHRRRLEVHAWTIDDASEMAHLLDLGVDGIMTDRPAVLRDVLTARGQWVP